MPIILLVVDTSASMAQKTYLGTSYLDVARNIIDTLQKQRMKDVATRGYDRFFLITTEDYPNCIKCGWRENSAVLHEQLKRLRPHGRGSIAEAFMNALKFINVHRAQTDANCLTLLSTQQESIIMDADDFPRTSSRSFFLQSPIQLLWLISLPIFGKGQLPPRRAHPSIVFSIDPVPSPTIQTDLPFDKYQLEPSPVAEYILDRHASTSANMCYQVFVRSSSRTEGVGKPFGYLKSASNGQVVNLIIMPYNYPVIVQLFEEYKPLRNALSKMKIETGLLDERGVSLSQVYPAALLNYLNELKTQGKEEFEKTCTTLSVLSQQNMTPLPIVAVEQLPCASPSRDWQPLAVRMKDRVARRDRREVEPIRDPEAELSKMRISSHRTQLHIHLCEPRLRATAGCKFRNPFIVPALDMVGHLPRLRANLDMTFRESTFSLLDGGPPGVDLKLHTSDELHQLPIAQMGNYEEYIKGLASVGRGPLRPVEPTPVRTHAFGNPFKTDKKSLAIDEVGEGMVGANAAVPTAKESRRERVRGDGIGRPPKRKPGPVSRNCLQQWSVPLIYFPGIRERRRTNSDRSSVVSDLSYTLDLDVEMPSTSGENSGDETALNEMTNGLNNTRLIELAGLEPEAESGEEEEAEESIAPPAKRRKTEGLSEEQMMERKLRIAAIVRRHSNNSTIWSELCRETSVDGSLLDQFHLADFALRDSRRFKRTTIVDQLTAEIQRIRKLLAM
ncbi:unnamed protein product [Angiostrongylus costaricensis]|uniref:VWFA domain-containing protein n=1 Tax=Angiostrongylus costaricensis TaxID=334426 RepID=A0A0R3PRK1_ANGCS|nr:unnamed protein product [Angiostrongylus costaricensis]